MSWVLMKEEEEGGGGLNLANADVLFREGLLKCWQLLTWGRGVSKITKKVLTYFMDGPYLNRGQIMPSKLLFASPSQNFRPSYGLGSQCIFLPSDYNLLLLFYVSYEKQDTFPCALRSFRLWSFGLSCKKIDNFFLLFIFNRSKSAYFNRCK